MQNCVTLKQTIIPISISVVGCLPILNHITILQDS